MTFSEIKAYLTRNRFQITNIGTRKLAAILNEMVDASAEKQVATIVGGSAFSTSTSYVEKDLVVYGGKLYKCKTGGHTAGAWDASHFDETTIAALVRAGL